MGKYKYDDWDDEMLVPYKSKSKKKKSKKSNHKHIYKKYIGLYSFGSKERCMIVNKCEICNKIEVVDFFISEPVPDKPLKRLIFSSDRVKELYPDLEVIKIREEGCSYVCE